MDDFAVNCGAMRIGTGTIWLFRSLVWSIIRQF